MAEVRGLELRNAGNAPVDFLLSFPSSVFGHTELTCSAGLRIGGHLVTLKRTAPLRQFPAEPLVITYERSSELF